MNTFLTQPGSNEVYIYFGIVIGLLIIYSLIIYFIYGANGVSQNDMLNTVYIENCIAFGNFGGWSLSHIVVFYIAGLLFPQQWVLIFILGVAWEFVEVLTGEALERFIGKSNNVGNKKVMYGNKWMDGNLSDIWDNSIGLFLGYWTAMFIQERRNQPYISN